MRTLENLNNELESLERGLEYLKTSKSLGSFISDSVESIKEVLKKEGYSNPQVAKYLEEIKQKLAELKDSKTAIAFISDSIKKLKGLLKREGYTNPRIGRYLDDLERVLAYLKRSKKTPSFVSDSVEKVKDLFKREEYINPAHASYLEGRIFTLREVIANYDEIAEAQANDEALAKEQQAAQVRDTLISTAKSLYESRVNSYMEQSFWGKTQSLFKGKKPKLLGESEILATYGDEAKGRLIGESIDGIQEQKEAMLAYIKENIGEYPSETISSEEFEEYMIALIASFYDNQIEAVEVDYDNYLKEGRELLLARSQNNGAPVNPNGNASK